MDQNFASRILPRETPKDPMTQEKPSPTVTDLTPSPATAKKDDQGGAAFSTRSPSAVLVPSPSACSGGGGEGGSGLSAL
jgi:hypothetical protein